MRKFTFLWCLLLCFTTALNAQNLPDKSSINDLLNRYSQLETQSGSISEHFTKGEQQILRAYFANQQPAKPNSGIKGVNHGAPAAIKSLGENNPVFNNGKTNKQQFTKPNAILRGADQDAPAAIKSLGENNPVFNNKKTKSPLFMAPEVLTALEEAEIAAAAKRDATLNMENNTATRTYAVLADIIPSAGATETFTPDVGDHFFDPGGPGGANTDGEPGNYPNCGCDTQTTLEGVSEIEFLDFGVNGTFDYLTIYDGTDATGTILYDNSDGGINDGDKTLTDMIASNGSASFTSTSGNFFFFFHSSTVVNWLGWDVEIIDAAGGGGGGGGTACSQDNPSNAFENGKSNNADLGRIVANDIEIDADTDYSLESISINEFMSPGVTAASVDVYIYEDNGGVPGAELASELGVVPTSQTVIGSNFGFDLSEVVIDITPVALDGQAGVPTTYWIGISLLTSDASNCFWENTTASIVGNGEAYDDGVVGFVVDPALDGVYTFSGTCTPIGGGGGGPCAQDNPSNAFENGKSNNADLGRIVANDIEIDADTDYSLESISINEFMSPGVTAASVDVYIYEDNGGVPGAELASELGVVPTSQTVIGSNFGFDLSEVVIDITPVALDGQAGVPTTYWIGISLLTSDASNCFWENTTASIVGNGEAYDDGVVGFVVDPALDGVYTFSGTCTPMGGGGPGPLTTVYGINNANQDLIGFETATPGNTEVFGTSPITVNFENAGAIDPANPTTGYALDNAGEFYSFDVTTGIYTSLGNIPGDWVGMEYDRASGTLYAIAGTDLYTIDPVGLSATLVGSLGLATGALPIALAIDGTGMGYTYDIVDDSLYSVDLATGATTLVGPIGFDANFGQGMAYDPTTDMVYMAAFNGGAFAAEWRSVDTATGSTTLIGNIVTDDPSPQVAWASVGETLPPPACPEPINLAVTNVEPTSADLSWDEEPNASSGYIWYVFEQGANPATDTPIATGTTPSGTTTATATGLSGGSNYDFYVVADCNADGLSNFAGPITFATPPACGGKFYDNGGPDGDYANDSDDTITISPENAMELVTVTFTSFDVEEGWDALYVYDGPDTTFPLIDSGNPATNGGFPAGGYYGTTPPGPFTSSDASGALTFVFLSDGSVPRAGWEADVVCAIPPPPNDMIANSIDVDEIGFPYTDPDVQMQVATTEDGNPNGCNIDGANGVWYNFVPNGDGDVTASITSPAGVSVVTFFEAADENASETDLTLVDQGTNQCLPGTSTTINTTAGQAYYVFVVNTGGPTDITIDGTNLGIEDNAVEGFSYYPNPADDKLSLKAMDNIENVAIYSILGQKVIDQTIGDVTAELNISSLSTGTYIMKVSVNGEIGTYKVIKR